MNRTASILLWLVGEALLVSVFLYAGLDFQHGHRMVNFIVSSILFTVVMMSLFRNTDVLVKRGVGKGMKWFFTLTYGLLSIGGMVYFSYFNPVDLLTQVIVQLIFLFVLALGMWGTFKPAKKSESATNYLKMEQNQLIMLRNVADITRSRAERRTELPIGVRQQINALHDEVLRIAPGNELVALKMEGNIMLEMNELVKCLKTEKPNEKQLHEVLKRCFKLIAEFNDTYGTMGYERS